MHVCVSVCLSWGFIKQLGLRLAVARRRVRQLHMAGKGTSQRAGSEQATVTWGHLEPGAAYVTEHSFCSVDIMAELGLNKMRL